MQTVKNAKEKQLAYSVEYKQLKKAMKEEFYLEAVAITYAVIEDRLVAFFHHAGIVTRSNEELRINRSVLPYIHKLMDLDDKSSIQIKNISTKITLLKMLLELTEEKARDIEEFVKLYVDGLKRKKAIARQGYMTSLFLQLKRINHLEGLRIIDKIEEWRKNRNQLIHALLNKNAKYATEAKKICAEEGYEISRDLDNCVVKPFKAKNQIRKKYNIQ